MPLTWLAMWSPAKMNLWRRGGKLAVKSHRFSHVPKSPPKKLDPKMQNTRHVGNNGMYFGWFLRWFLNFETKIMLTTIKKAHVQSKLPYFVHVMACTQVTYSNFAAPIQALLQVFSSVSWNISTLDLTMAISKRAVFAIMPVVAS